MCRATDLIIVFMLIAGPACAKALADGGQVRVTERIGDYQIVVFTSPNPLRVGPVDVSVFVQDTVTGEVVLDGDVFVEATRRDGPRPAIRAAATSEHATNKLFRAAVIVLPAAGVWHVCVECLAPPGNRRFEVGFSMEASPPLPRWLSVWPWFSWPIIVALLFIGHRVLVTRRQLLRQSF